MSSAEKLGQGSHDNDPQPTRTSSKKRCYHPVTRMSPQSQRPWSTSDFYFGLVLGQGLYGKVYHGRSKRSVQPQQQQLPPSLSPIFQLSQQVTQQQQQQPSKDVAIKTMDKYQIIQNNQKQSILKEKNILSMFVKLHSPWVIPLYVSFVDVQNLYLVMEYFPYTLEDVVQVKGKMREGVGDNDKDHNNNTITAITALEEEGFMTNVSALQYRYYSAQILCALEHIHAHNIIHRDIKPANIVVNPKNGHIKLIDFGAAFDLSSSEMNQEKNKMKKEDSSLLLDFVGTADYASPEMIKGEYRANHHCTTTTIQQSPSPLYAIDLWAFGCILHFLAKGKSPFHSESDSITIRIIMDYANMMNFKSTTDSTTRDDNGGDKNQNNSVEERNGSTREFILSGLSQDASDLMMQLLQDNPYSRLGMNDRRTNKNGIILYHTIRSHPFFAQIDWDEIQSRSPRSSMKVMPVHSRLDTTKNGSKSLGRTDSKHHETDEVMIDGASLGFDFFS